jgi:tRNA nucleotidyltransferase (CCA-adding enzyme)
MTNLEAIETLYRAFREKDYDAFLQVCTTDLEWIQNPGFPQGATYHGTEAVIEGVFKANDARWQTFSYQIEQMLDAGDTVIVVGKYIGRHRLTGRSLQAAATHIYDLTNGKVHRFRMFADTKTIWDAIDELPEDLVQHETFTARDLMSAPVRTIRPEVTIAEAQRILLRYGHSGLVVINEQDQLLGIISRRDIDIAYYHGFNHAPVQGHMATQVKTVAPDSPLSAVRSLMLTYDIGRLPVVENDRLIGIITRTDLLRNQQLAIAPTSLQTQAALPLLQQYLSPATYQLLMFAAQQAEQRGWHLYLVGGAVRDLLLRDAGRTVNAIATHPDLSDLDLVVDGFHRSADQGAGVELAKALQDIYPQTKLQIHGQFQTAALLWHHDPQLNSLCLDIATARTEFYLYPAANPEVEASSIWQDLYRRDFTINALAVRLTTPRQGELIDFFGGSLDLVNQQVRVLHANSFIEDPTRIFRAVRFAVRLGFAIEPQTEGYIRYAIASGIYARMQAEVEKLPALQTRLKQELKYILQTPYWRSALLTLKDLGAFVCIHSSLELTHQLEWKLRLCDRIFRKIDPTAPRWEVLLECLLASLEPSARVKVASGFQMPIDSIERLRSFDTVQEQVTTMLPKLDRPSQVVEHLKPYDVRLLSLVAIAVPRPIRRQVWRYLTEWSHVKSPLSGNGLRQLGYSPGKQFKEILAAILVATLEGEVVDVASAIAFVQARFPLES